MKCLDAGVIGMFIAGVVTGLATLFIVLGMIYMACAYVLHFFI